jgi:hypothetical protein
VKYERVLALEPMRVAWILTQSGESGDSWVLFDSQRVIDKQVITEHESTVGRLASCLGQDKPYPLDEDRFLVVPPYPPTVLKVGSHEIPLPDGASAWAGSAGSEGLVPPPDRRTIGRGYSHVILDSKGLERRDIEVEDERDFAPLVESLEALPTSDFEQLIQQLDALPERAIPQPISPEISRLLVDGNLVHVPRGYTVTTQGPGCESSFVCRNAVVTVVRGESSLVFEAEGYRILYEYVVGEEKAFAN